MPDTHFEEKILDKLDTIGERISKIELTFVKLESDLQHHMATEDANKVSLAALRADIDAVKAEHARTTTVEALQAKVQALESIQQQAQGAAWAVRLAVAISVAASGAIGWILSHFSAK